MEAKVSIIIPVYNRIYSIEKAVESCLSQSYKNVEIVVCDDQSTDGTDAFLKQKYAGVSNVVLCTTDGYGKGSNAARNTAIKNSSGDYIAFLDSDDYLLPTSIEDRINAFSEGVGLVYGDVLYEKNGHKRRDRYTLIQNEKQTKYVFSELALCCTISIMIKREVLEKIGKMDEAMPAWQDDDLVTRASLVCKMKHCESVVAVVGLIDKSSISKSSLNNYIGCKKLVNKNKYNILRETSVFRLFIWWIRVVDLKIYVMAEKNRNKLSGILLLYLADRVRRQLSRHFRFMFV